MKFRRQDGTFGEFEPLRFPHVEYHPDQAQLLILSELERDVVAGEAGRQVAAAMFDWLDQVRDGICYPKEKI